VRWHPRGWRWLRGASVAGSVAFALAGLGPAWLAAPAPVAAVTLPTGGVVAWGDGSAGQTDVPPDAYSGVISVAAGCSHSLALRADGRVVAWGDNSRGQTDVPAEAQSGVAAIVAGCNHSLALKANGTIVAWGDNAYGQSVVPSLPSWMKWTNIAAGTNHSVGIARDVGDIVAYVYVWGDTSSGQADFGGWVESSGLVDVEAGGNQTIGRWADGRVVVWGSVPLVMGEDNRTEVLKVPAGLTNVVWMSMGRAHAAVVRAGGSVVAWGENHSGQVTVPKGLSGVKAVAAGGYHTIALLGSGRIVSWGANDMGQSSPPPRTSSRFVWVAAGLKHSLAVGHLSPGAPKDVTARPRDGAISVSWDAPDDPGYTPITSYAVTAAPGGKTCTTDLALACTIDGLDNGTFYTVTVTARNSIGIGAPTTTLPVVPAAPTPTAPEATAAPTVTPTPSPAPTATSAPAGDSGGGGGGGGLPLALIAIAIAILVGTGVAILVYKWSTFVARARALAVRLRAPTSKRK
jgi:hypothetical protein